MFRLVRYFSITSLVAFVIVTAVLAVFYRQSALNDLIALRENNNVALTQAFANSLWPEFASFVDSAGDLDTAELADHPGNARLREAVLAQMAGLSVVKVKVYDLDALTVFSTEVTQIGDDKSDNVGYLAARAGQVATELTHRDSFSAFELTIENRDVVSSYVPIQPGGPDGSVEGVFEVYDDVTPLLDRIEQTQRNVILGVVGILALLYTVLFFIVRHGEGIIRQQVAEREQAENARRTSEARLRTIIKSAPVMLWAVDKDQKLTFLEGRGPQALDMPLESAIGRPITEVYKGVAGLGDEIKRALDGEESASLATINEFTFDTRYTPLRDGSGQIVGVIGVATDITERMMAEGALGEASRDLETRNQQLERVHEFLNVTLETMSETVQRGAPPTEVAAYLDQVRAQFDRLA